MDDERGVTRSIIDEVHSSDNKGDQMQFESGVTRSITDQLHFLYIEGDQMEGESGLTRSIVDELHSWDIQKRSNGRLKWFHWKYH